MTTPLTPVVSTARRPVAQTFATLAVVGALSALGWFAGQPVLASEAAHPVPAPVLDEPVATAPGSETAVFAGGCFWGVQGVFQHVKGVTRAVSGYSGGSADTAHYRRVGEGDTGHAEAVEVTYDPKQVTYGQLLQVFFSVIHDPTELNRQGPDTGTQYRSAVFPKGEVQQRVAAGYIAQLQKAKSFSEPIVTRTEPFKAFYPAEGYHQDFLALNPNYPYIRNYDLPKLDNLKRLMPERYRDEPALVLAGAGK